MKSRKKRAKSTHRSVNIKWFFGRLFALEAHILLNYGRLVRITILLVAATAAGFVFIHKPPEVPIEPTQTSIIDSKTVDLLQRAIIDRSQAFTSPPQINPQVFEPLQIPPSPSPAQE